VIRALRRRWFCIVRQKKVPLRLWDFGYRWCCEIMNHSSNSVYSLEGRTPLNKSPVKLQISVSKLILVSMILFDIMTILDLGKTNLGVGLVYLTRLGQQLSFYILTSNCEIISRTTVTRVTNLEKKKEETK
jgi:hypothetical protein